MANGPRRKRAHLWVRVYATIFDVDETRLKEAIGDRPDTDGSHVQEYTNETDEATNQG